jgi:hypothetical protein
MKERKLKSGVNFQGGCKANVHKTNGRKTRAGCIGTNISEDFAASIFRILFLVFQVFDVIFQKAGIFLLINYKIDIKIKNILENIN